VYVCVCVCLLCVRFVCIISVYGYTYIHIYIYIYMSLCTRAETYAGADRAMYAYAGQVRLAFTGGTLTLHYISSYKLHNHRLLVLVSFFFSLVVLPVRERRRAYSRIRCSVGSSPVASVYISQGSPIDNSKMEGTPCPMIVLIPTSVESTFASLCFAVAGTHRHSVTKKRTDEYAAVYERCF